MSTRASALTTLRVGGELLTLIDAKSETQFIDALQKYPDALVMGGGSNLLFSDAECERPVIKASMRGIAHEVDACSGATWTVRAGENWDHFVSATVEAGCAGLETLSGIPGTVGGAPIQNIGAYGSELKDCFHSLTYFDFSTGEVCMLDRETCRFGYRDSIFKHELRDRAVILDISFALPKQWQPNLSYAELANELSENGLVTTTARDISEAVIAIRRRKLPDPSVIGNAGSFFKNPVVSKEIHTELFKKYPQLVSYAQPDGGVKLAAGAAVPAAVACQACQRRYVAAGAGLARENG